jgi:hypothetical protein
MPEVTDGVHIPLRRRGSRDRASYANRPVGKGAFLAGEKIALRVLLQPRMWSHSMFLERNFIAGVQHVFRDDWRATARRKLNEAFSVLVAVAVAAARSS